MSQYANHGHHGYLDGYHGYLVKSYQAVCHESDMENLPTLLVVPFYSSNQTEMKEEFIKLKLKKGG